MRQKRWLKMSAFALVVANVIAMPNTLSAIAEWSGKGSTSVALTTTSEGCGCS